jgi:hypothetical protein
LENIIKRGSEFIKYVKDNQTLIKKEFPDFNSEIFEMQTESLRKYSAFFSDLKDIKANRQEIIKARERDNNALTDRVTFLHKPRDPAIKETTKDKIEAVSELMEKITSRFYSPLDHLKLVFELILECDQRTRGNNQTNTSSEEFLENIIKRGSEFIEYVQNNPDLIRRQFPDFNPEIFKRQTESLEQYYTQQTTENEKENALTDLCRSKKTTEEKIKNVSDFMWKLTSSKTSQFKSS